MLVNIMYCLILKFQLVRGCEYVENICNRNRLVGVKSRKIFFIYILGSCLFQVEGLKFMKFEFSGIIFFVYQSDILVFFVDLSFEKVLDGYFIVQFWVFS